MTSPNALSPLDCHNAMETAAFDFADARNKMVDSQVRPNKVADPRIIAAMRGIFPA